MGRSLSGAVTQEGILGERQANTKQRSDGEGRSPPLQSAAVQADAGSRASASPFSSQTLPSRLALDKAGEVGLLRGSVAEYSHSPCHEPGTRPGQMGL